MTNIQTWLARATRVLQKAEIGTARLDALVLLEDATGQDRGWLLAHPELKLSAVQQQKLEKLLKRRVAHQPIAYIRGKAEFYGREFVLTSAVLQPRPESETMIDMLKELVRALSSPPGGSAKFRVADVGAGNGALGITALLELPNLVVDLLEIDSQALKIAKMNVDKFTLDVRAIRSDLLTRSSHDYDILLCNLPYVPDDYQINLSAGHEPRLAIFGGPDGLDVYRRLFEQVQKQTKQPLYILTESLPPQHQALAVIAAAGGYKLQKSSDFIQRYIRT